MTLSTRRLVALPLAGVAVAFIVFGVIRGAIATGPAHGKRLIVAIEPPVDDAARTMATHVVRTRLGEKGLPLHIVPAGDRLVVEIGSDDAAVVNELAQLLERTGKLEVRAGDVSFDGRAIRRAEVLGDGVAIEVDDASRLAKITPGTQISFALDGVVRMGVPDRVLNTELHVRPNADATPSQLVDLVEAGAVHPLHVRSQASFSRATGFFPRAWPFFAIAAVLLVVVAILARRR
ncbi:MAG: hypothetical protein HOV81_17985 [Kofleriaceae bacterium]|nr:hypothetical protein [Kofleriaceae bacterium]